MEIYTTDEFYEVTFDDKHSYEDWGVYLKDNTIELPTPRRVTVDIPFRNGMLDVTPALSKEIYYENRTLTFDFLVADNDRPWRVLLSEITRDVHGKKKKIIIDTDPYWYWEGVCTVETPSRENEFYTIQIKCDCYPYKKQVYPTRYAFKVNSSTRTVILPNDRMPVRPKITADKDVNMVYTNTSGESKTVLLTAGTDYELLDMKFYEGNNTLVFNRISADSNVVVIYQQGAL